MAKDKQTSVDEAEVLETQSTALSTPQAVMVSATQLKSQMKRDNDIRAIITQYIKENMVSGKDYGTINVKGTVSKPSLFKPGSEKFCSLFKLRAAFRRDDETIEMLGNTPGILGYICELVDQRGRVVGEGRGTAKTDPSGSDFDINKQVKIAQKRAQIDAVLRTGGLSDFFTQDLEDMPQEHRSGAQTQPERKNTSINAPSEAQLNYIARLKREIVPADEQGSINTPTTSAEASDLIKKLLEMKAS